MGVGFRVPFKGFLSGFRISGKALTFTAKLLGPRVEFAGSFGCRVWSRAEAYRV